MVSRWIERLNGNLEQDFLVRFAESSITNKGFVDRFLIFDTHRSQIKFRRRIRCNAEHMRREIC